MHDDLLHHLPGSIGTLEFGFWIICIVSVNMIEMVTV